MQENKKMDPKRKKMENTSREGKGKSGIRREIPTVKID